MPICFIYRTVSRVSVVRALACVRARRACVRNMSASNGRVVSA